MDPVGNYGKGVGVIAERLTREGCDVTLKLYEGARHEMHHEINRDEVFADLLSYINGALSKKETRNEH
jgi:alpha-beta hydrolase superfamily lysophospholipase